MYYNPNNQKVLNFNTKLYIAKYKETTQDENLNQKQVYYEPQKFFFNIQPVNKSSEIREFGELVNSMKVAVITQKQKYLNKFNEFDLAYLDGVEPINELEYGDMANYRIYAVRPQNTIIKIYFLKRVINNQ